MVRFVFAALIAGAITSSHLSFSMIGWRKQLNKFLGVNDDQAVQYFVSKFKCLLVQTLDQDQRPVSKAAGDMQSSSNDYHITNSIDYEYNKFTSTVSFQPIPYPDNITRAGFEQKRTAFKGKLQDLYPWLTDKGIREKLERYSMVRRDQVFEDSADMLLDFGKSKSPFWIEFIGEHGVDLGGLLREWYSIMTKAIFDPTRGLFTTASDPVSYTIDSSVPFNEDHYRLVGRFIAKAVIEETPLDFYFTRSMFKHILRKPVDCKDLKLEDTILYNNLQRMRKQTVAEITEELGYDLTFSVEVQRSGSIEEVDLVQNGRTISVSDQDKRRYIELRCQMKLYGMFWRQVNALVSGFEDIIDHRLISIFTEDELELLIGGMRTIDVDDLERNTDYWLYDRSSQEVEWFWQTLRSFDQPQLADFLQFVTGSRKAPLGGFAELTNGKFTIAYDWRASKRRSRLPTTNTCTNKLTLPPYDSHEKLKEQLERAIQEPLSFTCM